MAARKNIVGLVFNKLQILCEVSPDFRGNGRPMRKYLCLCACGNKKEMLGHNVTAGISKTCGCEMGKFKHGHNRAGAATPTYQTWRAMLQRCTNPAHRGYKFYGARGVLVCPQWANPIAGFSQFLKDMGERPALHTLDRRDNLRGYSPTNCRWATRAEQYANQRINRGVSGRFLPVD